MFIAYGVPLLCGALQFGVGGVKMNELLLYFLLGGAVGLFVVNQYREFIASM